VLYVISAGIAEIQNPRMGWDCINKYLPLFRPYIPVHWIPAIPAGMTWTWGVYMAEAYGVSILNDFPASGTE